MPDLYKIRHGFFMHGVPARDNHRGMKIIKLYEEFSEEPKEIQLVGMSASNVRANNSVKEHTSVLRFIARARLPKQKL